MTGRVAVLSSPRQFELADRSRPEPGRSEVVVRVRECGICGSDLKMWSGTHAFLQPPLVMGHEINGTVAAAGRDVQLAVGTPVTVFPPVGCGSCFHCRRGKEQLCEAMEFFGGQRPGGLADYVVAPATHVLEIPDAVPKELRVLIEPLSVAAHGVSRGAPGEGDLCVVLGAGAIGLFTALVLRHQGAGQVIVVDPVANRRQRAEAGGFVTVDPTAEDLAAAVDRLIRPEGADCVFECVGSQATIETALALTRKGGRTIVVGNAPARLELDGLTFQRGDRTLVGVLMYDLEDFRTAMELLSDGLLDPFEVSDLITRYSLPHLDDAFDAAKGGTLSALKAVVEL